MFSVQKRAETQFYCTVYLKKYLKNIYAQKKEFFMVSKDEIIVLLHQNSHSGMDFIIYKLIHICNEKEKSVAVKCFNRLQILQYIQYSTYTRTMYIHLFMGQLSAQSLFARDKRISNFVIEYLRENQTDHKTAAQVKCFKQNSVCRNVCKKKPRDSVLLKRIVSYADQPAVRKFYFIFILQYVSLLYIYLLGNF